VGNHGGGPSHKDLADVTALIAETKDVEIVQFGSSVGKYLRKIRNPEKYLFVATGHQGEPKATLCKMAKNLFPFKTGDEVIFSCNVIPTPENIKNRERLEAELDKKHVRIFKDVHVSGHAAREDHRDMLLLLKPEHVIPTHGTPDMLEGTHELALDMGWKDDKIHILKNGERIRV
jgi:ribonuclease J